jgi:hypothetical protein
VDEAAFRNYTGNVIRFGPLAELIEPVGGVHYSGKRDIVAFRHLLGLRSE